PAAADHGRWTGSRPDRPRSRRWDWQPWSELHHVAALEFQHCTGFGGVGDLVAEFLENAPHLAHLLCIGTGELSLGDMQGVFQADAYIAAEHSGLGDEGHLEPPGGEYRPDIVVAEEAIGRL